jgi:RNA-dependent RNA polymerase
LFLFIGDIRRLEAVDIPALHRLKNVIVFPMNGPRPHAMEMSGGDLDGDTFWICQHEELIFKCNDEPFDYQDQTITAQKKAEAEKNKNITIEDVCDFFTEYIKADKSVKKFYFYFNHQPSFQSWDYR